ncbi:MAG: hypothetical protein HYS13_14790 [Planctomycetia bacterium]|nr:hypothetical protein [Planctomycetia bacterium]
MQRHVVQLILVLACSLPLSTFAQDRDNRAKVEQEAGAPEGAVPVVKLELSPAPAPRAALKYRLLPEYTELTPGNAAQMYYRALLAYSSASLETRDKMNRYVGQGDVRPEALVRDENTEHDVRGVLSEFQAALDAVDDAARREHCDWELRVRDLRGPSVVNVLLGDVHQTRNLTRLLSLEARLRIAEGRSDDAVRTLQTGFALSRHTAQTPTLVNSLVGIASATVMAQEVEHLIEQPGSPNLYWALISMPQPVIDLRDAMEQERAMPQQLFPLLRDAETAQRTPKQWEALLEETVEQLQQLADESQATPQWQKRLAVATLISTNHPPAKKWLVAQGRKAEEVEQMPPAQAIVLHAAGVYRYAWDEMFKWSYLPYWQAEGRFEKTQKKLEHEGYLGGVESTLLPLGQLLLPAVQRIVFAQARLERRMAELRTIEALRMHAAEHGAWPAALADVTAVPLSVDPITGKPFSYKLEGTTAVLEIAVPKGESTQFGKRYELTLRKGQ